MYCMMNEQIGKIVTLCTAESAFSSVCISSRMPLSRFWSAFLSFLGCRHRPRDVSECSPQCGRYKCFCCLRFRHNVLRLHHPHHRLQKYFWLHLETLGPRFFRFPMWSARVPLFFQIFSWEFSSPLERNQDEEEGNLHLKKGYEYMLRWSFMRQMGWYLNFSHFYLFICS